LLLANLELRLASDLHSFAVNLSAQKLAAV
jgi:hypothetical protein